MNQMLLHTKNCGSEKADNRNIELQRVSGPPLSPGSAQSIVFAGTEAWSNLYNHYKAGKSTGSKNVKHSRILYHAEEKQVHTYCVTEARETVAVGLPRTCRAS